MDEREYADRKFESFLRKHLARLDSFPRRTSGR